MKPRAGDPVVDDLLRTGVARGTRRLRQNAQIRGLALNAPVFAGKGERSLRVPFDREPEARLFALMQLVAAGARRVEACREIGTVDVERRARIRQCLFRQCKA